MKYHSDKKCSICGGTHNSASFKNGFICEECIKYIVKPEDL